MLETLLALPIVLFLGAGIIHMGLVYQAKSNLEYASLMAARVGSTTSLSLDDMRREVKRRMKASDSSNGQLNDLTGITIEIVNPGISVFEDWGRAATQGVCPAGFARICEIPNDNLLNRDKGLNPSNGSSGLNIQEANLLRIKVTYFYDSMIPFMNLLSFNSGGVGVPSGTPLVAFATVRMQSPARITNENSCCFSP